MIFSPSDAQPKLPEILCSNQYPQVEPFRPSKMMMNYHKYPPHPVYHPHPPLLGTSHDPRIGAPPPRPYGAAPPPPARSYLEPYSRAEMDMPRPSPVYHYPHSSSMPSPTSYAAQTVYAPFRPESSGYHVSQTGRGTKRHSMEADTRQPNNHQSYNPSPNHNLHNGLERRMVYREGRIYSLMCIIPALVFVCFCCFYSHASLSSTCILHCHPRSTCGTAREDQRLPVLWLPGSRPKAPDRRPITGLPPAAFVAPDRLPASRPRER